MANNSNMIPIPGRLHSVATDGQVAGANEIHDDAQNKKQSTINSELINAVGSGGSVDSRIADAKAEIIGDAATDYNTLGKLEDKVQAEASRAEGAESALDGRVDTLEDAVGTGGSVDERIAAEGALHYLKSETYNKTEVNGLVSTPHQEYVTVSTYASLPASGSEDTIYRVSNYDGTQVAAGVYSEYAWDGTQYVFLCAKSSVGEVFDISEYNSDATYADLSAALGVDGANVPADVRKGGMSVKYVQSSDNKYVQFRLMNDAFSTNEDDWQGVDNAPTVGSSNILKGDILAQKLLSRDFSAYVNMRQGTVTNGSNQTTIAFLNILPLDNRIESLRIVTNKPNKPNCEYRLGYATYSVNSGLVLANEANIVNRQNVTEDGIFVNPKNDTEVGVALTLLEYNLVSGQYEELLISEFDGYNITIKSVTDQDVDINDIHKQIYISDNDSINTGLFEVYAPNKEREISELSYIRVYKLLSFQNKYLIGLEAFNSSNQRIFKAYRRYSSQVDATEAMSNRFLFDEESGNAILIDFSKFTGDDFIIRGFRDYECTVLLEKYNIISSILFPEHGCEFIDNFENGNSKQILGDAPIFGGYDGYIKDPSVFIINGVYNMYASYAYTRTNNWDTAWYKSVDGIHWEFQKLVFVRGFSQSTTCIAATSKPILCNGVWHIWLTLNVSGYGWCIGHAQCEDIENPEWVADQNVPLLYNANHHLLDPFIIEDNGTYYLFFTYTDTEGDSATSEQIAYVTSTDCLNWSAKVDVTAINADNRVCGEGPMVIKAPNGKWRIFTASLEGQSLTTEHLDSWESDNIIGPYTKTGIVKMPLSSWGNVCYGHGDVLEIPAGTNNNPKTEYVLYFQETWNGFNYTSDVRKVNVAVGIAKSTDLYHFEAFNYQYYNWADFWKYEDGFVHPESMTCGWKPFIRTYDFYNAFECHSYIKGTGGAIGLVFFAQREQYIHCLEVLLDIANQKVIARVNANDGASTQVLLESNTVLTSNIAYKLEVCKFQHHYIVKLDGVEVGRFYLEDFEELAPGFICNSQIGYFKNLNIKGDLNN